jgi:hypothetical protein
VSAANRFRAGRLGRGVRKRMVTSLAFSKFRVRANTTITTSSLNYSPLVISSAGFIMLRFLNNFMAA